MSFHRPAKVLLGSEDRLAGRRHAYERRFFHEMGYCSDSRGGWHRRELAANCEPYRAAIGDLAGDGDPE